MVEISYKEQVLCQLYKDNGLDKVEIEFFSDTQLLTSQDAMKFSLEDFLQVLAEATDELKKLINPSSQFFPVDFQKCHLKIRYGSVAEKLLIISGQNPPAVEKISTINKVASF